MKMKIRRTNSSIFRNVTPLLQLLWGARCSLVHLLGLRCFEIGPQQNKSHYPTQGYAEYPQVVHDCLKGQNDWDKGVVVWEKISWISVSALMNVTTNAEVAPALTLKLSSQ